MKDFQQRVVDEKNELDFKIESLVDFIGSDKFNSLPSGEGKRLVRQKEAMTEYSEILDARISAFN